MNIPVAIIIAAIIVGCSYVLGNLYKMDNLQFIPIRINTVTGTVSYCAERVCKSFRNE